MAEPDIVQFLQNFRLVSELATNTRIGSGQPLRDAVSVHLRDSAAGMPVISESVSSHRYADWDVALEALSAAEGPVEIVGVGGAEVRYFQSFADLLADATGRFPVAAPDYSSVAIGPNEHRQILAIGVRLFTFEGTPVAVMQRAANPRFGHPEASVDVVSDDPARSRRLLDRARALATERSVLRGKVLTFADQAFGPGCTEIAFLERPDVRADEVVLSPGTLERVTEHVVGIAEQADFLRRHGQHLKRGVLLYGPPGTGKTHTVRHLISRSPEHTVIVLAGAAFRHVRDAAVLARALQPAIVVLEDCDLVAEDRSFDAGARPLLFEVLDAMDGLDGDGDVTFVLTTNRVEALEHALTQRPGRVDLAAEIALPDAEGRRRLLELYSAKVTYGDGVLADVAGRTDGQPASFIKELMRRSVLAAAKDGTEPGDAHLSAALDGMLEAHENLTRVLLGGETSLSD